MANGVATFDALAYYNELKSIGMDDRQANLQAEAMRKVCEAQTAALAKSQAEQTKALQDFAEKLDEKQRNELATKGDIAGVKAEIAEVKGEIALVRGELRETELRLRNEITAVRGELGREIEKAKNTMIYWFAGTLITLVGILAKGFHWFGL